MLDSLLNPVHILILLAIVVVIFGPKRLPEMGRKIGETLREINTATSDIRSQIGIDDIAGSVHDIKSSLSLTGSADARASEQPAAGAPTEQPAAAGPVGPAVDATAAGAATTDAVATDAAATGATTADAATTDVAAREMAATAAGRPATNGPGDVSGPGLEEFGRLPRSDGPRR
jgi:TatA/E family protein of Tat protein translocase